MNRPFALGGALRRLGLMSAILVYSILWVAVLSNGGDCCLRHLKSITGRTYFPFFIDANEGGSSHYFTIK